MTRRRLVTAVSLALALGALVWRAWGAGEDHSNDDAEPGWWAT